MVESSSALMLRQRVESGELRICAVFAGTDKYNLQCPPL